MGTAVDLDLEDRVLGSQFPHQGAGGQLGKAHGRTEQGVLADSQGMGGAFVPETPAVFSPSL